MTANELAEIADGLSCEIPIREWIDNEPKNVMNDIATMLRQQQAEIEALKQHWSDPQTDLIVLLREEVTLMQKYLQEQNLREHFVTWRNEK
jgi:hypothetical protein